MAYRSLAFNTEIIWRAPLPSAERELANSIRDKISALRPHLLDFLRLNEEAPPHALTLAEWSQPATLSSFIATGPTIFIVTSPVNPVSKTAAVPLGAMVHRFIGAPLMLALLSEERAISPRRNMCASSFMSQAAPPVSGLMFIQQVLPRQSPRSPGWKSWSPRLYNPSCRRLKPPAILMANLSGTILAT